MKRKAWILLAVVGVALTAASAAGAHQAIAQQVWQADVRVQAFDVTAARTAGPVSVRVAITSDRDDDARAVRLEILLPVGVGILRLAEECRASPSVVSALTARVSCLLGDVPVGGLREVRLLTTGVATGMQNRFTVFVTSDTPDPDASNNYAERAVR
ncbi:MAG: hypothetical protein H7Z74_12585 [Anaerolineae bacterium]|nr:hypothetical protein [Gemmatimonadaceae bacterium]